MPGAVKYWLARLGTSNTWVGVATTTGTNATVPWRSGITEYAVFGVDGGGAAVKSGSVWTGK